MAKETDPYIPPQQYGSWSIKRRKTLTVNIGNRTFTHKAHKCRILTVECENSTKHTRSIYRIDIMFNMMETIRMTRIMF